MREKKKTFCSYRRKSPVVLVSIALVITVLAGFVTVFKPAKNPLLETVYAISTPEYPTMAQKPQDTENLEEYEKNYALWKADRELQTQELAHEAGSLNKLIPFFQKSSVSILTQNPEENCVYSPLSLYLSLSMLAEVTGGESREQILNLLGSNDMEDLRIQAEAVWNANYCDDGATKLLLANSVWLNEEYSFVPSTLQTLAKAYYASSFRGQMGSEELDAALRSWLNSQTGNFLQEQAQDVALTSDTVAALVSTVFYQAAWEDEFSKDATEQEVFHSPQGNLLCDFMKQDRSQLYYRGDGFSAVSLELDDGNSLMWLLLPDQETSPEELITNGKALSFLLWEEERKPQSVFVHLSVPKFDVSCELSLEEHLQNMGVVNLFSPELSNFSPLTDRSDLYINSVEQATRVTVDEKGCTGASYTAIQVSEGADAFAEKDITFTLDRPFLFAVTTSENLPLFVGVVNQPAEK